MPGALSSPRAWAARPLGPCRRRPTPIARTKGAESGRIAKLRQSVGRDGTQPRGPSPRPRLGTTRQGLRYSPKLAQRIGRRGSNHRLFVVEKDPYQETEVQRLQRFYSRQLVRNVSLLDQHFH